MAERVGFEPTCGFHHKLISSQPRYDRFDTAPYMDLPDNILHERRWAQEFFKSGRPCARFALTALNYYNSDEVAPHCSICRAMTPAAD